MHEDLISLPLLPKMGTVGPHGFRTLPKGLKFPEPHDPGVSSMLRKSRKFQPLVGESKLEERLALSVSTASVQVAARNVTFRVQGRFTSVDFVWNTSARTVTYTSRAPGTIRGLGSFNVTGDYQNVQYNRAGRVTGTLTLTSTTDPENQLVFAVRGPSPGASPRGPVATTHNLQLVRATGKFSEYTNQPNSMGTIILPPLNLPMRPPAQITGIANLANITLNMRRP